MSFRRWVSLSALFQVGLLSFWSGNGSEIGLDFLSDHLPVDVVSKGGYLLAPLASNVHGVRGRCTSHVPSSSPCLHEGANQLSAIPKEV